MCYSSTYPRHGPRWSRNGTGTRSVQTPTFVPGGIGSRARSTGHRTRTPCHRTRTSSHGARTGGTGRPDTGPRSSPDGRRGGSGLRRRGSLYHGDGGWPDEHALPHVTIEISGALHSSIVLAAVILQLNADPVAGGEVSLANEADDGIPAIAELYGLPNRDFRHIGQCPGDQHIMYIMQLGFA